MNADKDAYLKAAQFAGEIVQYVNLHKKGADEFAYEVICGRALIAVVEGSMRALPCGIRGLPARLRQRKTKGASTLLPCRQADRRLYI